ncbi:MAG: hypothetical protein ACTS3T_02605 [Almyronema sp.]
MQTPLPDNAVYLVTPSLLECPKCGKHTIVKEEGKYQCISCDFKRELKSADEEAGIFGKVVATFLTFVVIMVLFL